MGGTPYIWGLVDPYRGSPGPEYMAHFDPKRGEIGDFQPFGAYVAICRQVLAMLEQFDHINLYIAIVRL